jgi:hypothetical protein
MGLPPGVEPSRVHRYRVAETFDAPKSAGYVFGLQVVEAPDRDGQTVRDPDLLPIALSDMDGLRRPAPVATERLGVVSQV